MELKEADRKADGARWTALLTPRPPALTGRVACAHWVSERAVFVMLNTHRRKVVSKHTREGWPEQGEERRMWRILDELKHDLSKTRASCAEISDNLLSILDSPEQQLERASSKAAPPRRGAPSRVESGGRT